MNTKEIALKALQKLTTSKDHHSEGEVAKAIESETTKMPSDLFLWTGLGCLGVSAILRSVGLTSLGQLIGQLSAPILIMGLYNKVVKLHGSEGSAFHGTPKVAGPEKRAF
jgi:hypothetical protein